MVGARPSPVVATGIKTISRVGRAALRKPRAALEFWVRMPALTL